MSDQDVYKLAFEREKKARLLAEKLLEDKTRQLYDNVLHLEGVVTELKQAQAQLIQSEKMASLGQLTAGIAHEINNPIGFSYSNLSTLVDYLKDYFSLDLILQSPTDSSESAKILLDKYKERYEQINGTYIVEDSPELLRETLEGLDRVKNIINNLKKISYKGNSEFIHCNINECIEDCLNLVKNEIKYSMRINLNLGECAAILGQPSDLNQVFINLFINASHACQVNGSLTITSFQKGDFVIVTIKDNGIGISQENLTSVFDPFFTTKAVGEGTGLGLSISHGIIEKHGGEIKVESKEKEGTCFTITLPIAR